MEAIAIRILEKDSNRRGDLFGQLMSDLFVALGYGQPRLNIHKSGRELDLTAEHRLESRGAVAECKATADPVGGDDVNKFVGALDAERNRKRPVTGYFVSLAGYRETAIEQERQGRHTKIILLTGQQVVQELVKGRIIIDRSRATEIAGRCCAGLGQLILDPISELLAHRRGWIWAVYYTQGKERTHVVLIHGDGTPLARVIADEVIDSDHSCGGGIQALACLNPSPSPGANAQQVAEALTAYGQFIANECGNIQLDGLPADSDVGSRRLRLENLFVPLHLEVPGSEKPRQPVGLALSQYPRLALLAPPGGGKSTLIKRLAVAYADPARYREISDSLPQREWLPLFFRCRELREHARGSFADLLEALSRREPVRQHAAAFRGLVDRALLAGRVLLLVDGLDEISEPGDRAAFVCMLRTALQAYPAIAFVVTSREAGFRHVAAHLASVCTHATLSPFDDADIRRLTEGWHREVVGDTQKVRDDARQLAATIVRNDRIKRLAVNPLLLTTLLLVKRWVGSLPTRRAVLYGKAVELLLMTWNTEGHEPFPEEEALPQLCYVASAMMLKGSQKISRPRLAALVQEARVALPTELGYVKGTVDEFIHRIEDRSSLLMMTGYDVESGRLIEFFEFRHLTFQEFLCARAMVEGWHPGRTEKDSLVSVLEPHFAKEDWSQVIPLATVLGGKETEAVIQRLTQILAATARDESEHPEGGVREDEQVRVERIEGRRGRQTEPQEAVFGAIVNCLADEAAARPETIRAAVREIVRRGSALHRAESGRTLARGRYGADLRDEAARMLVADNANLTNIGDALLLAVWVQTPGAEERAALPRIAEQFVAMLTQATPRERCEGANGIGWLCYSLRPNSPPDDVLAQCTGSLSAAGPLLESMLFGGLPGECCAAMYALSSLGACRVWVSPRTVDVVNRLFRVWRDSAERAMRLLAARALGSQPLVSREESSRCGNISRADCEEMLKRYDRLDNQSEKPAALAMSWYCGAYSDADLAISVRALLDGGHVGEWGCGLTLKELLERLGQMP